LAGEIVRVILAPGTTRPPAASELQ
jgi:hypothetical protein